MKIDFTQAKRGISERQLVIGSGKVRLLTVLPSSMLDKDKPCISADQYKNGDNGHAESIDNIDLYVPIWRICKVRSHSIRRSKPAILPWHEKGHHVADKRQKTVSARLQRSQTFRTMGILKIKYTTNIIQPEAQSNSTTFMLSQLACACLRHVIHRNQYNESGHFDQRRVPDSGTDDSNFISQR